jgi:hypothetical protein
MDLAIIVLNAIRNMGLDESVECLGVKPISTSTVQLQLCSINSDHCSVTCCPWTN